MLSLSKLSMRPTGSTATETPVSDDAKQPMLIYSDPTSSSPRNVAATVPGSRYEGSWAA